VHLTCIEQDLTWICATQHTRLCACLLVYDTHICARAHTHTGILCRGRHESSGVHADTWSRRCCAANECFRCSFCRCRCRRGFYSCVCVLRFVRVRGFSLFQSLLLRRVSPLSLAHQRLFLPGPHSLGGVRANRSRDWSCKYCDPRGKKASCRAGTFYLNKSRTFQLFMFFLLSFNLSTAPTPVSVA
jgi:hypothetical protein